MGENDYRYRCSAAQGKTIKVPADMTYKEREKKYLDKSGGSGIIKEKSGTAVSDVHSIGRLDKNIYSCVTSDIQTDEVIITNERIAHIKERHPQHFEKYCDYMQQIAEDPDYIIEANKPNTALVLKAFSESGEQFKTIVRLVTSTDNSNFKNSIITFMRINEKEWLRLITNKKTLYKRE